MQCVAAQGSNSRTAPAGDGQGAVRSALESILAGHTQLAAFTQPNVGQDHALDALC